MTAAPEIAVVVSPRDWAERLHRFVADHGGARVRARVLDAREAVGERYRVLVAEDLTSFLTPHLVDVLHRDGRRILGVYDPTEPQGRRRLEELGVDAVVAATVTPDELLRSVDALALTAGSDLDVELAALSGAPPPDRQPGPEDRAAVVAVGGPAGGPGSTEVAIGLTLAAGRRREAAVLVDADDVAPAVAQRLDLPLHPNVRTAVDVVQHRSGRLTDALVPLNAPSAAVLCGLPGARDWGELRPGEVVDVLDELVRSHDHVVADVGHRIEELGGIGSGHGRYELSRQVLARADRIVAVAAGTPVGLARLLDWIADLRALTDRRVHAVVNRAPASRFKRGELEEELRRTYSPPSLAFVGTDRRVEEAAWSGDLVTDGPFAAAMDRLAETVLAASRHPARTAGGPG